MTTGLYEKYTLVIPFDLRCQSGIYAYVCIMLNKDTLVVKKCKANKRQPYYIYVATYTVKKQKVTHTIHAINVIVRVLITL